MVCWTTVKGQIRVRKGKSWNLEVFEEGERKEVREVMFTVYPNDQEMSQKD